MHSLLVLLLAFSLDRAYNGIYAHINELPKGILRYIKIHFGLILLIYLVIDLIMKLGYGFKAVFTGVNDCTGFGLDFICKAYFLLIGAKFLGQMLF